MALGLNKDTKRTLVKLLAVVKAKGAASVRCVALLDKAERREASIKADYIGFPCPNEFVVGCVSHHG